MKSRQAGQGDPALARILERERLGGAAMVSNAAAVDIHNTLAAVHTLAARVSALEGENRELRLGLAALAERQAAMEAPKLRVVRGKRA